MGHFGFGGVCGWEPANDLALTHNDETIGYREGLVKAMCDDDHRDTHVVESLRKLQELLHLANGKIGSWLVHDDKPGIEGERAADRYGLPLTSRQASDLKTGIHLQIQ
jgi:hypothetical protein